MSNQVEVTTKWLKKNWVPVWLMRWLALPDNDFTMYIEREGSVSLVTSKDGINWK